MTLNGEAIRRLLGWRDGEEDWIMPKMKTHKATAKRFKITGKGKLRRLKTRRSHLRRKKSKRVRRSFDKDQPVAKADRKRVRRLLGLRNP
jgi:large subunit ribosomal protein L35